MLPIGARLSFGWSCVQRAMSRFVAQAQSLSVDVTVTTEDSEDRAAELVLLLTGYSTRENWT